MILVKPVENLPASCGTEGPPFFFSWPQKGDILGGSAGGADSHVGRVNKPLQAALEVIELENAKVTKKSSQFQRTATTTVASVSVV